MLLETKLEILISVQEWLKTALEKDSVVKYVALEKFETWTREHSNVPRRVNTGLQEILQEKRHSQFSCARTLEHRPSTRTSSLFTVDRKAETTVKITKLKTELMFI